jgi:hypothetical protein
LKKGKWELLFVIYNVLYVAYFLKTKSNQTWGQLHSNVIDYITITLQCSWLHYITITSIFKCNQIFWKESENLKITENSEQILNTTENSEQILNRFCKFWKLLKILNRFYVQNFQNLFRIFSNVQNFQNLFRIFSNVENLFRIFSGFWVIFRIIRHFSEFLAHSEQILNMIFLLKSIYFTSFSLDFN